MSVQSLEAKDNTKLIKFEILPYFESGQIHSNSYLASYVTERRSDTVELYQLKCKAVTLIDFAR